MNKQFLINAMYDAINENYGAQTPFQTQESNELESDFKKKYAPDYKLSKRGTITDAYSQFSDNLTDLVWGNIRNAFEVGFNTAVQLLMGGGTI